MQTVVVIPVYRAEPLPDEVLSMQQTKTVLCKHPIRIICPDDIQLQAYFDMGFESSEIIRLPKHNFSGIHAYNAMLCSKWFYQLFEGYDYILIFQTDAWVFKDVIEDWSQKAYDYIGAPWLWKPQISEKKPLLDLYFLMRGRVGNGGVSLRKIQTMLRKSWLANLLFKLLGKNEDFIWLLVNYLSIRKMAKPDALTALHFCIEMEPEDSFRLIGDQLPFAVHAYVRYGAAFWQSKGVNIAN